MNSGMLYKFEIKYWRTPSHEFKPNFKSFMKMRWSSNKIPEQMIPTAAIFRKVGGVPIQIRDYKEDYAHRQHLRQWDHGFKNSRNWVLDDIPLEYENAQMIRLNEMYEKKELKFSVNQKVHLYVAFPETKPSPLTPDFKYADQKLSLLKVKPTDSPEKVKAELSIGYKIYFKSLPAGPVNLPIQQNAGTTNLIVWVVQVSGKPDGNSCGGKEQIVTSENEGFKSCDVSPGKEMQCAGAFPAQFDGSTPFIWGPNLGKNKYAELKFKVPHQVLKFDYKPIKNQVNNIKVLKVEFDDGQF